MIKINLSEQNLINAIAAAAVVLLIIVAVMICSPLASQVNIHNKKIKEYKEETKKLKEILFNNKQQDLSIKLPSVDKLEYIVEEIARKASNNEITIDYLELPSEDTTQSSELYKRMIIPVQISDNYKKIGKFLSEIRRIPDAVIDVDKMMVASDLTDSSKVLARFSMLIYLSKKDETK